MPRQVSNEIPVVHAEIYINESCMNAIVEGSDEFKGRDRLILVSID